MMYTISKSFEFDASHRLITHPGKCKNIHGHRYKVEVSIGASEIDEITGMLMDFGDLGKFKQWLMDYFDHATIVNYDDSNFIRFLNQEGSKVYAIHGEPTAENMAKLFFNMLENMLPKGMKPFVVVVWETPNCKATYTNLDQ